MKESKERPKIGEGELVVSDDAMDEPKWCFVADVIEETIFTTKKDAAQAIVELTADLIRDDVLMVRVNSCESHLSIEFSFDHNTIVREEVTLWFKEEDVFEHYLRRLQRKKGH